MLKPKSSTTFLNKQNEMQAVEQMAAGTVQQYISFHWDFVLTISLTKHSFFFPFSSLHLETANALFSFYFFPQLPRSRKSPSSDVRLSQSTLGHLARYSAWAIQHISYKQLDSICLSPSCCEIMQFDRMNIYHAVTSPPSYNALIITTELDHLSHGR